MLSHSRPNCYSHRDTRIIFARHRLSSDATTEGWNIALQGTTTSTSTNTEFQYGVYGASFGEGTGARYGVRSEVHGSGSNFTASSRGLNFSDAVENGGSYGAFFDTRGTGASGSFNVGVRGTASKDQGINIGVWGTAQNGTENWAGRFDGDILIQNNTTFSVNRVGVDDGNGGSTSPYAGEAFLWGDQTPNIQFGAPTWEGENGVRRGFITMYGNTTDGGTWYRGFVHLNVASENSTDEYGTISLEGPSTPNIYLGALGGQPNNPAITMFGSTEIDDGNGGTYVPELIQLRINDDGNGGEIGAINLSDTNGNSFTVDANGVSNLTINEASDYFNVTSNGLQKVQLNANYDDQNNLRWGSISLYNNNNNNNINFNYKTWESNPNLPYLSLTSTVQQDDGNGGLFRPDLIWMDIEEAGTGTESVNSISQLPMAPP